MKKTIPLYYEDTHKDNNEFDKIIVFVHGNLISCKYWCPLINKIQQQNQRIRCISMDLRGFGRSQEQNQIECMSDLSNDVGALLNQIFSDKDDNYFRNNIYLAGWSLGGNVIMQLAVDYPNKYEKLILIAGASVCGYALMREDEQGQVKCQTKQQVSEHQKVALQNSKLVNKDKQFMKMIFDKVLFNSGLVPEEKEYDQLLDEVFLQTSYIDVCWALNQFDISSGGTNQATTIKGPVLIYHGDIDLVIPKIFAEGNAKEIGEEKCKVIIRPGIGHMPPNEDTVILADEIIHFVK